MMLLMNIDRINQNNDVTSNLCNNIFNEIIRIINTSMFKSLKNDLKLKIINSIIGYLLFNLNYTYIFIRTSYISSIYIKGILFQ